jgi:hypothetical protein
MVKLGLITDYERKVLKLGLITDYERKVLIWDGVSVPMRSVYHTDSKPTFS